MRRFMTPDEIAHETAEHDVTIEEGKNLIRLYGDRMVRAALEKAVSDIEYQVRADPSVTTGDPIMSKPDLKMYVAPFEWAEDSPDAAAIINAANDLQGLLTCYTKLPDEGELLPEDAFVTGIVDDRDGVTRLCYDLIHAMGGELARTPVPETWLMPEGGGAIMPPDANRGTIDLKPDPFAGKARCLHCHGDGEWGSPFAPDCQERHQYGHVAARLLEPESTGERRERGS